MVNRAVNLYDVRTRAQGCWPRLYPWPLTWIYARRILEYNCWKIVGSQSISIDFLILGKHIRKREVALKKTYIRMESSQCPSRSIVERDLTTNGEHGKQIEGTVQIYTPKTWERIASLQKHTYNIICNIM